MKTFEQVLAENRILKTQKQSLESKRQKEAHTKPPFDVTGCATFDAYA